MPIGISDAREPVLLDLKESSELGMGPHGLCVGATGSGKSELLRTLVLALVATHPPEDLALVLVDYKGGATFAPFADLPHVAGVITNLENQAGLVERVHASLAGEVKRRQQALQGRGQRRRHRRLRRPARRQRPDLDPLPHLFVVIDEFGELLTAKPDFIDLFLSIGRSAAPSACTCCCPASASRAASSGPGHLPLLPARPAHLLRRRAAVLDTTDAFHLPPLPGFGYLKVDTSHYERFKAGYVSGAYRGPVQRAEEGGHRAARPEYEAFNTPADAEGRRAGAGRAAPRDRTDRDGRHRRPVGEGRRSGTPHLAAPAARAVALDKVAGPLDVGPRGMQLAERRPGRSRCRSACSTTRPSSGRASGTWTSPWRAATPPSSAARSPARPPCCAPSSSPSR